jgi:hypothetical protein
VSFLSSALIKASTVASGEANDWWPPEREAEHPISSAVAKTSQVFFVITVSLPPLPSGLAGLGLGRHTLGRALPSARAGGAIAAAMIHAG